MTVAVPATSGVYRCEVSAEETFETHYRELNVTILGIVYCRKALHNQCSVPTIVAHNILYLRVPMFETTTNDKAQSPKPIAQSSKSKFIIAKTLIQTKTLNYI